MSERDEQVEGGIDPTLAGVISKAADGVGADPDGVELIRHGIGIYRRYEIDDADIANLRSAASHRSGNEYQQTLWGTAYGGTAALVTGGISIWGAENVAAIKFPEAIAVFLGLLFWALAIGVWVVTRQKKAGMDFDGLLDMICARPQRPAAGGGPKK